MVDPRELTAGYTYPRGKGVAFVAGVLRDGERGPVVWLCTRDLRGHRAHSIPSQATQCAQAELERRLQGAKEVTWLGHCVPCWVYWDLGLLAIPDPADYAGPETGIGGDLMRGVCPRCSVPFERVKIAVLERQERSAR